MFRVIQATFFFFGMLLGAAGLFAPFDVPAGYYEPIVRFGMQLGGIIAVLTAALFVAVEDFFGNY